MSPPKTAAIVLRNQTADLARLSAFVSEFCEAQELPPDFDMALNLVAEEAFINVVRYAHPDGQAHEIPVRLSRDEASVTFEIEDDGEPFNPLDAPEFDPATPIEKRRAGGLGIHLLRNLMSELHYERRDGRNLLTMRKNLAGDKESTTP